MAVAGSYTTEALVSAVRLRCMLPATTDNVSFPLDSDIISLANQEVASFLVPWLRELREGQLLVTADTPLVASQAAYALPQRAHAADIYDVQLVDSLGNPVYPPMRQADPEDAVQFPAQPSVLGQPTYYYYRGNSLVVVPTPQDATQSLRILYQQRPNQLVASTACIAASSFPAGAASGYYRVGISATEPTTFVVGAVLEFALANPNFSAVAAGTVHAVSTGVYVELSGSKPSTVSTGDWLCLTDTAPVLTGIPADVFGMFAQWLALKVAEIRGDGERAKITAAAFSASEKQVGGFLRRRDETVRRKLGAPQRFFPRFYWR